jgi:hypothetical protein
MANSGNSGGGKNASSNSGNNARRIFEQAGRENDFGRRVAEALRSRGAMIYPMIANRNAPAGWPDKLVWSRAWTGLLELKAANTLIESIQALQLYRLHRLRPGYAVLYRQAGNHGKDLNFGHLYAYTGPDLMTVQHICCKTDTMGSTDDTVGSSSNQPVHVDDLLTTLAFWAGKCDGSIKQIWTAPQVAIGEMDSHEKGNG